MGLSQILVLMSFPSNWRIHKAASLQDSQLRGNDNFYRMNCFETTYFIYH